MEFRSRESEFYKKDVTIKDSGNKPDQRGK